MTHEIDPNDPYEIKVWAQMFFDDGSVSRGIRVSADTVLPNCKNIEDVDYYKAVTSSRKKIAVARKLLKETNRDEGFLLVWGNGCMDFKKVNLELIKALEDIINAYEIIKKSL